MALRTQRVAPQFLEQLNSLIPGTGLTVAETLGFRPISNDPTVVVRTEQNLGAPLAGFKTPRDLTVEERIIGGSGFGKLPPGKPLPPLFGGTFEQVTPEQTPQRSGESIPGRTAFGRQTGFTPGTPPAELARVLSENVGAAALDAGGATAEAGVADIAGAPALPSPGSLTFARAGGGTTTSDSSIAFGTLPSVGAFTPSATRSLLTGDLDRPGAGAGRRRLAGQLVRRVRDPELQGTVLRTRPLSSLQPRRRASVDPVKKRLLNTLIR